MSLLNLNLPTIGGTNANEDPKIRTALSDIQTVVNALDNANIASGADINGSKLDDATISAAKLASDSVETAKIVNDAVTNDKIGDDAVDTAQIADDAVENAQIADDAVDTAQIADGAVETAQINDGAVTAAKIAASTTGTVTFSNSAIDGSPGVVARKYANGQVMLEGSFLRVGASKNTTYVTLPAGYRPSATRYFAIKIGDTEILGTATVNTNGTMYVNWSGTPSPTPYIFFLDGITFHAA